MARIAALPAGHVFAINAGAPAAIVAAMRKHVDDDRVSLIGCNVLHDLSSSFAGKAAVVAAGGRAVLSAAVARHDCAKEAGSATLILLEWVWNDSGHAFV